MSHQHICLVLMPLTTCPYVAPYEYMRCLNHSFPVRIESVCPGPGTHALLQWSCMFNEPKHLSSFFISYFSGPESVGPLLPGYLPLTFPLPLDRQEQDSSQQEARGNQTEDRQTGSCWNSSYPFSREFTRFQFKEGKWSEADEGSISVCWSGKPTSINAGIHEF